MSTIWEMAQIIRAEEAAALAAKSEASQHATGARVKDVLKAPPRVRGAEYSLMSLVTRLARRKAGSVL